MDGRARIVAARVCTYAPRQRPAALSLPQLPQNVQRTDKDAARTPAQAQILVDVSALRPRITRDATARSGCPVSSRPTKRIASNHRRARARRCETDDPIAGHEGEQQRSVESDDYRNPRQRSP